MAALLALRPALLRGRRRRIRGRACLRGQLGVAVLFGLAAGTTDGGLIPLGLSGRQRLLNLLHGAYGVGTAIGPLV